MKKGQLVGFTTKYGRWVLAKVIETNYNGDERILLVEGNGFGNGENIRMIVPKNKVNRIKFERI